MAECEKMMRLCEESLDRELTPEEQAALDLHLETCPACAAYLADLRFLTDTLSETPDLPAGLHERIMSGIENEARPKVVQQPHRRNRKLPVSAMLVAAAACVVLALSGGLGSLMNNFNLSIAGGGSSSGGAGDSASAVTGSTADSGTNSESAAFKRADTASAESSEVSTDAAPAEAGAPGAAEDANVPQPASYSAKISAGSGEPDTSTDAGDSGAGEPPMVRSALPPSVPSNESVGEQMTIENENNLDEAPAIQSRLAAAAAEPQVGAFITDVMSGEVFAGCYLVEGGSDLPSIGQEQQRDANFAYCVVENNLSQLESLLDTLEKAGCTVTRYDVSGVVFNDSAKRVIFVVRLS